MSLLLSQQGRGCEVEPKALTNGVFTSTVTKKWVWQLQIMSWSLSSPDIVNSISNLTASLATTKVIERRKKMVLEQLVSSWPRETIWYPPVCALYMPKAPSCIQTDSWEHHPWCKHAHTYTGQIDVSKVSRREIFNTEIMSCTKLAMNFARGPSFPSLTVKGGGKNHPCLTPSVRSFSMILHQQSSLTFSAFKGNFYFVVVLIYGFTLKLLRYEQQPWQIICMPEVWTATKCHSPLQSPSQ